MHVKALKVYCDIVRRRSFSRAAAENGMSQSAASQIVHQLEERLSAQLIDRSKRPFVLTPAGEQYYLGCRDLVERFELLEEQVRSHHQEVSGRVDVASIYSVGLSHMNQFVQQFLKLHPQAAANLHYEHPARVVELVETDVCDLGLVSFPKSSRTLEATLLREEPMVLVCSPAHPLAGSGDLAAWQGAPLVGFDHGLRIRRETDRLLQTAGVQCPVTLEFDNIETIKRAVEINAGVSLLPAPTVAREVELGTLVATALRGVEFARPVGIIRRRSRPLGKTAQRFVDLLMADNIGADTDFADPVPDTASGSAAASSNAGAPAVAK